MNQYPKDIKFKYPWRKYQQRVLDELDKHLIDQHLHVIAPPGSGKTVLGLEVAIRLNRLRYLKLNGPVDTEISVPELVIEGDLCPHQDYIHFTFPTEKETESILDFRKNIDKLLIKSRINSLATQLEDKVEHRNRWR